MPQEWLDGRGPDLREGQGGCTSHGRVRRKDYLPGLGAFAAEFVPTRKLLVGGQGVPLEEFLGEPAASGLR